MPDAVVKSRHRTRRWRWLWRSVGLVGVAGAAAASIWLFVIVKQQSGQSGGAWAFLAVGGFVAAVLQVLLAWLHLRQGGGTRPVEGWRTATGRISSNDHYAAYLDSFVATNRCPPWNTTLCSDRQIRMARIHYAPARSASPPAFTQSLDRLGRDELDARLDSLPRIAEQMWRGRQEATIYVLLGDPGSGKSSLAVQLVHSLAIKCQRDTSGMLPVYVNLAHFKDGYAPTPEGLESLAIDSIAQGCPRHLLRTQGSASTRLQDIAKELVIGYVDSPVLFVFDGMDEIPTNQYMDRVKAIADFMDNSRRQSYIFLVTCRYEDFINLADHTHNLKLQRFDLLPWTRRMVRDYLTNKLPDDEARRRRVLKTILEGGVERSTRYFNPLEIAFLAEVGQPGAGTSLHELFDTYIRARLDEQLPSNLTSADAMTELGRLAFQQTWATTRHTLNAEVADAACRAGLLRDTPQDMDFEIRPLRHHLAAKELLRKIRDKRPPRSVKLQDINARDALKSASAQAGSDPQWVSFVIKQLQAKGDARTQGDRISVAAYALTTAQLATSDTLRNQLTEVIAWLVSATDDVERKRCLQALERQPSLLDPVLDRTQVLFAWIVTKGPEGAVAWLLQLFARDRTLRRRHRRIWRTALVRALNQGILGRQVQLMVAMRLPPWRIVRIACGSGRYALLFAGHYAAYVAAWSLALFLALPIYRGLRVPLEPQGFLALWLRQFDFGNLQLQASRLYFMVVSFYLPRYWLLQKMREGLSLDRWWARLLKLILLVVAVRLVLLLLVAFRFAFAKFALIIANVILVILYAVLLGLALALVWTLISNPRDWRRILTRLVRRTQDGGASPEWDGAESNSDPDGRADKKRSAALTPTDVLLADLLLTFPGADVKVTPEDARSTGTKVVWGCAAWLGLIAVAYAFGGLRLAAATLALGIVSVFTYVTYIEPVNSARRRKRRIQELVRERLAQDLRAAFVGVLCEIADEDYFDWVRITYVKVLNEVRFDTELHEILEKFYETMPDGTVKTHLTDVVLRAHHEVRKAGF